MTTYWKCRYYSRGNKHKCTEKCAVRCTRLENFENKFLIYILKNIIYIFENYKFSFRCTARAWSISNKITKLIGQHNHPPDEVEDFKPHQDSLLGHDGSKTISGSGGEGVDDE